MSAFRDHSVIGIDIGGTNLRFALVGGDGAILHQERGKTASTEGYDAFFSRLTGGINRLTSMASGIGRQVSAVGIGVPGVIGGDGLVHSSVNLQILDGVNLREVVTGHCNLPVVVLNDANAFACGEKWFGAGRTCASLLVVTLGTGVGGGLILDDRLWTGIDGAAGEFGHLTVEPDGHPCPCGNRGCLEQYASATAIAAAARRALGEWGLDLPSPGGRFTAHGLAEAARHGDRLALGIFAEAGRYLGIAAAGVANFLNLEALIIGGGMAESFDLLVPSLRQEIDGRSFPVNSSRLKVLKGALGDDAGILGSAAMALKVVRGAGR